MAGWILNSRAAFAAVLSPLETIFRISAPCWGDNFGRRPPILPSSRPASRPALVSSLSMADCYTAHIMVLRALAMTALVIVPVAAQEVIALSAEDGGKVCADLYGSGPRAVVLAHGGRFQKESWRDQARVLARYGFQALVIDFRGFGCSTGPGQADFDNAPFEKDVLAAVHYLRQHGAKMISVVGGSFGGSAAGDASIKSAVEISIESYFSVRRLTYRRKS